MSAAERAVLLLEQQQAKIRVRLCSSSNCLFVRRKGLPPQAGTGGFMIRFDWKRLILALFLAVVLHPLPAQERVVESPPGPAVQIIPLPQERSEPVPAETSSTSSPPEAHVIENCTVTWYTEDTCGKSPDHPAYGVTASGLPVEADVTCAVDPEVIPLHSAVYVQYADGSVERLRATDTGVKGNWIDIYTPDYEHAVQCGLQKLTVYWTESKPPAVNPTK